MAPNLLPAPASFSDPATSLHMKVYLEGLTFYSIINTMRTVNEFLGRLIILLVLVRGSQLRERFATCAAKGLLCRSLLSNLTIF